MFHSKRLAMLLSITMLVASATLLSGCRLGCQQGDIHCQSGISPTYTVPIPPTPTPPPAITDPKQLVQLFLTVYSGGAANYSALPKLFDSAYAKLDPSVLACAADSIKQTYGPVTDSTLHDAVVTGTVASVIVDVVSPGRSATSNFNLKQEGGGWKIDTIIGWIGGDTTPDNPVGDSASCLQTTDTGSGATTGITGTTGISGTTGTSGTTGLATPTP